MRSNSTDRRILLVRHTAVAPAWSARCYGATDVPLSGAGCDAARTLAREIGRLGPMRIYASPLRRAAFLAALIAREAGCAPIVDVRLAERNFGAWERRPWSDIYAESGDAMMGMLTAPSTFRPGGGETTEEVRDRVLRWHAALPPSGRVIVVSHGGPIAALVGTARGLAPVDWAPLIPPCGGMVEV